MCARSASRRTSSSELEVREGGEVSLGRRSHDRNEIRSMAYRASLMSSPLTGTTLLNVSDFLVLCWVPRAALSLDSREDRCLLRGRRREGRARSARRAHRKLTRRRSAARRDGSHSLVASIVS